MPSGHLDRVMSKSPLGRVGGQDDAKGAEEDDGGRHDKHEAVDGSS